MKIIYRSDGEILLVFIVTASKLPTRRILVALAWLRKSRFCEGSRTDAFAPQCQHGSTNGESFPGGSVK